jgi:16S rRNA (cytosine1402-N4)-methyltransferase
MSGRDQPGRNPHEPVLYQEIIHGLRPDRGGIYIDCTVGSGGHAAGLLKASSPDGRLLGLDVDPGALEMASERLAPYGSRVRLVRESYRHLLNVLADLNWGPVDGILLDLGYSSMQIDNPGRGFSFLHDGPLDMRFNPDGSNPAGELVNELPEEELADILFRYGEERQSRRIAKAIIMARPIQSTVQLAALVAKVSRSRQRRHHPATRTFQALRIAVNEELESLEQVLPQAVEALAPGGRLAVISFHSLEDRIVKQFIRRESQDCICPPGQPVCTCSHRATVMPVSRRPMRPGQAEISRNPRSRSAKLRFAEKLEYQHR